LSRRCRDDRLANQERDQVEYLVVFHDDKNKKVRLSLRQVDILKALASDEELLKKGGGVPDINCGNAR
jgi:glutamate--cysteine ligase catalytic subunit